MLSCCETCILEIKSWLTEKNITEVPFFPDEIITNILMRLPATNAMRCRVVCRRWRDLTSTRDFVDLHLKNSIPTILVVARKSYCLLRIYELGNWWEPATMANDIYLSSVYIGENSYKSSVLFSHNGLIVLQGKYPTSFEKEIVILNPVRPNIESVSLTFLEQLQRRTEIYGVYYHPSLKEYCSLWKISSLWKIRPSSALLHKRIKFEYKILNLGSNPSLRTISYPFSKRVKMENAIPLLINNYLYWKLESKEGHKYDGHSDIMKFDVISEEFMVIHCPVPLHTKCMSCQTHLLNSDGVLSFVLILPNKITIWRLEDDAEQLWTTTEYTFNIEICNSFNPVDVISLVDGKLAIQLYRSLFVCNLMEGTVINCPDIRIPAKISFYSHQMSLASLSNGNIKILIDQDDQVVVT